ncbi:MAG: tRNA (guanosine(37)-N1)-methyltransferase TrmD [Candidatus Eiseniibacteriota bacterium]|nr:MAG: tRNA (guanosine(37)-N1)-methyltransferase TrmD [Candidatus Eisenbacteria bacterium]
MEVSIATIFPSMFEGFLSEGLVARAARKGLVRVTLVNPRDFATDSYKTVDDYPYGGGPGMVMKAEPVLKALSSVTGIDYMDDAGASRQGEAERAQGGSGGVGSRPRIIILSPQGRRFSQEMANELSTCKSLVLVCGRYKAMDERIRDVLGAEEVSIGDYVLSGGELAAMVLVESVVRLLPGAMEDKDSAANDSFAEGLLDCAYYTRPEVVAGRGVPEVLVSGNHAAIRRWRRKSSLERTLERRPDLLEKATLSEEDRELLEECRKEKA